MGYLNAKQVRLPVQQYVLQKPQVKPRQLSAGCTARACFSTLVSRRPAVNIGAEQVRMLQRSHCFCFPSVIEKCVVSLRPVLPVQGDALHCYIKVRREFLTDPNIYSSGGVMRM